MKQNILIGLSMVLVIAFSSCEKEEFHAIDPVTTRAPKPLVKDEIGSDYTGTITYNNKRQIVEEHYDLASITYTYTQNHVEMNTYDNSGTLIQSVSMKLNPKGLVIEMVENGVPRTNYFQYDNKDRVIKEWAINDDGSAGNEFFFFYNAAGDMVKDSLSKPDGYWNVYNNEFYTDISNTVAHENYGKTFLGKQSKHYMKKRVMTSSLGELHEIDFFPPVLDAESRIIDRTVVITNVTENLSNTYTVQNTYY